MTNSDSFDPIDEDTTSDATATDVDLYIAPAAAERGSTNIKQRTMSKIVAAAVASVPGVISDTSSFDRLTRGWPRYDIQLDEDGSSVAVNCTIAVTWPSPVTQVAQKVRETVTEWINTYTDVPVIAVDVTVAHVEPGHRRITVSELQQFKPVPAVTPIAVESNAPEVKITTTQHALSAVTVTPTPASASVRSVALPQPVEIKTFTVGAPVELREITVSDQAPRVAVTTAPQVELSPIVATPPAQLSELTVQPQQALKPITVAPQQRLAPIAVHPVRKLKTIEVAAPRTITRVKPPQPVAVSSAKVVSQPRWSAIDTITVDDRQSKRAFTAAQTALSQVNSNKKRPLVPVRVTNKTQVRKVRTPKPLPLATIPTPTPHRLADVTLAPPLRLEDIKTSSRKLDRISTPRAHRLKSIRVTDTQRVSRPKTPRPLTLGTISTSSQELRPVEVSSQELTPVTVTPHTVNTVRNDVDVRTPTRVIHPAAPQPEPLKPVTISSTPVKAVKK